MLEDIKLPFIDKKVINKHEREYQIGLIDGQGVMTSIDIYPGIQVIYNNFHCFTNSDWINLSIGIVILKLIIV